MTPLREVGCGVVDLRTRRSTLGTLPILELIGEVDLASLAILRDAILRLVTDEAGRRVVVDMDGVSSLDDSGLGVILGAAGRARQRHGELVVVSSNPQMLQRMALTRFDRAVDVVRSISSLAAPISATGTGDSC